MAGSEISTPERFYEDVLDRFSRRVRAVRPDQWHLATPCPEWDVRALVNHVCGEQLWAVPLLAGETVDEVGGRFDGDVLGGDPAAVWDKAAAEARVAFAEPDALERTVHLSFGPTLATEYAFQMTVDLLLHEWDLAAALGGPDEPPDSAPDPVLVHDIRTALEPQIEGWRRAGAFGPEVPVPPGSNEWIRLLAMTGRDPAWQPPSAT